MSELRTALSKSAIAWVEVEDRAWPVWYVWSEPIAYLVAGPGEQTLPELPPQVRVVIRSKDSRAAIGTVPATARRVSADDPEWPAATAALAAARLNAAADAPQRWAVHNTVWALEPDFEAPAPPATAEEPSGARAPWPSAATTDSWHPRRLPVRRRRK